MVRTYTKTFENLKREDIWRLWADVNHWPAWHEGLESCTMEGPFEVGNYFMLKPKSMKAVKIKLIDMNKGFAFTDCTKFPGAQMFDAHMLEETPAGLKISNQLFVIGPLKWLWIKLVAQRVADSIPQKIEALVNLARKSHE